MCNREACWISIPQRAPSGIRSFCAFFLLQYVINHHKFLKLVQEILPSLPLHCFGKIIKQVYFCIYSCYYYLSVDIMLIFLFLTLQPTSSVNCAHTPSGFLLSTLVGQVINKTCVSVLLSHESPLEQVTHLKFHCIRFFDERHLKHPIRMG